MVCTLSHHDVDSVQRLQVGQQLPAIKVVQKQLLAGGQREHDGLPCHCGCARVCLVCGAARCCNRRAHVACGVASERDRIRPHILVQHDADPGVAGLQAEPVQYLGCMAANLWPGKQDGLSRAQLGLL
jgi:hypothetical protein